MDLNQAYKELQTIADREGIQIAIQINPAIDKIKLRLEVMRDLLPLDSEEIQFWNRGWVGIGDIRKQYASMYGVRELQRMCSEKRVVATKQDSRWLIDAASFILHVHETPDPRLPVRADDGGDNITTSEDQKLQSA